MQTLRPGMAGNGEYADDADLDVILELLEQTVLKTIYLFSHMYRFF